MLEERVREPSEKGPVFVADVSDYRDINSAVVFVTLLVYILFCLYTLQSSFLRYCVLFEMLNFH
jgi:hypothetical protein